MEIPKGTHGKKMKDKEGKKHRSFLMVNNPGGGKRGRKKRRKASRRREDWQLHENSAQEIFGKRGSSGGDIDQKKG